MVIEVEVGNSNCITEKSIELEFGNNLLLEKVKGENIGQDENVIEKVLMEIPEKWDAINHGNTSNLTENRNDNIFEGIAVKLELSLGEEENNKSDDCISMDTSIDGPDRELLPVNERDIERNEDLGNAANQLNSFNPIDSIETNNSIEMNGLDDSQMQLTATTVPGVERGTVNCLDTLNPTVNTECDDSVEMNCLESSQSHLTSTSKSGEERGTANRLDTLNPTVNTERDDSVEMNRLDGSQLQLTSTIVPGVERVTVDCLHTLNPTVNTESDDSVEVNGLDGSQLQLTSTIVPGVERGTVDCLDTLNPTVNTESDDSVEMNCLDGSQTELTSTSEPGVERGNVNYLDTLNPPGNTESDNLIEINCLDTLNSTDHTERENSVEMSRLDSSLISTSAALEEISFDSFNMTIDIGSYDNPKEVNGLDISLGQLSSSSSSLSGEDISVSNNFDSLNSTGGMESNDKTVEANSLVVSETQSTPLPLMGEDISIANNVNSINQTKDMRTDHNSQEVNDLDIQQEQSILDFRGKEIESPPTLELQISSDNQQGLLSLDPDEKEYGSAPTLEPQIRTECHLNSFIEWDLSSTLVDEKNDSEDKVKSFNGFTDNCIENSTSALVDAANVAEKLSNKKLKSQKSSKNPAKKKKKILENRENLNPSGKSKNRLVDNQGKEKRKRSLVNKENEEFCRLTGSSSKKSYKEGEISKGDNSGNTCHNNVSPNGRKENEQDYSKFKNLMKEKITGKFTLDQMESLTTNTICEYMVLRSKVGKLTEDIKKLKISEATSQNKLNHYRMVVSRASRYISGEVYRGCSNKDFSTQVNRKKLSISEQGSKESSKTVRTKKLDNTTEQVSKESRKTDRINNSATTPEQVSKESRKTDRLNNSTTTSEQVSKESRKTDRINSSEQVPKESSKTVRINNTATTSEQVSKESDKESPTNSLATAELHRKFKPIARKRTSAPNSTRSNKTTSIAVTARSQNKMVVATARKHTSAPNSEESNKPTNVARMHTNGLKRPLGLNKGPPTKIVRLQNKSEPTARKRAFAPRSSIPKHPAPIPPRSPMRLIPGCTESPPPVPQLTIVCSANGIVLQWRMHLSYEHATIKMYELFGYDQMKCENDTSYHVWKKMSDIKPLSPPMACTVTECKEGHIYHFMLRAVDIHSRAGAFSEIRSIKAT